MKLLKPRYDIDKVRKGLSKLTLPKFKICTLGIKKIGKNTSGAHYFLQNKYW